METEAARWAGIEHNLKSLEGREEPLSIACALLLSACGTEPAGIVVPRDLLMPAPGWTGPVPRTAGELMDAVAAEKRGRELANARIEAVKDTLLP